jgi:hypothetical protein
VDAALRRERRQRLTDASRPQAARVAELGQRQWPIRLREDVFKLLHGEGAGGGTAGVASTMCKASASSTDHASGNPDCEGAARCSRIAPDQSRRCNHTTVARAAERAASRI